MEIRRFTASRPTRKRMNVLLRGIIGGFSCGGAPLPSGAGSTRQPDGCFFGGEELFGGESGGRGPNVLPSYVGFSLPAARRHRRKYGGVAGSVLIIDDDA